MRLVRFTLCASLIRDPVDFPGLASVLREGLLKMCGSRSHVRPDEPNQYRSAIECLLIEKFTASILKFADRRLPQNIILAVGPVQTPLVRLGIVETQGQAFDVASSAIGLEFLDFGAAIPDLSGHCSAVKLNP